MPGIAEGGAELDSHAIVGEAGQGERPCTSGLRVAADPGVVPGLGHMAWHRRRGVVDGILVDGEPVTRAAHLVCVADASGVAVRLRGRPERRVQRVSAVTL